MASVYTVLKDTFSGTTGASLTGHVPDVQNAADTWALTTFAGDGILAFAAGGGATSSGSGSNWSAFYPMAGAGQDGTFTFVLQNAGTAALAHYYLRADAPFQNLLDITVDWNPAFHVVQVSKLVAGTYTPGIATSSATLAPATAYTLVVVLSGTTLVSATLNGANLPELAGLTIPAAVGHALWLRQEGGAVGDVVFGSALVTVPGPASATVTGPTAIVDGVASGDYTIALSSAVPAGGAGIPFTPTTTVFSSTPTPSAVTVAPGATAGTFTETASTTGTGVVSATAAPANIAGLTITGQSGVTASSTAASAFTLTGPGSGFVANASTSFTITPNGTYSGTITITPSGGGLSTPIVKTFSSSATPQTFTITPASAGTVTLTPSNNGGLTNPSAPTYTSNARTLAVSPSSVATSASGTLTFTGGGTRWNTSAPTFGPSGVTGFALGSVTVVSDTSCTAPYTTSTGTGTETFTDSTTSATATLAVAAPAAGVAYYCAIDGVPSGAGTPTLVLSDMAGSPVTPSAGGTAVSAGTGAWIFPFTAPEALYVGVITAGTAVVLDEPRRLAAGLDLAAPLGTPRSLDAVADDAVTVGDALWCAASTGAGKQGFTGRSLARKTPAGTATIRTLTLDDGSTSLS